MKTYEIKTVHDSTLDVDDKSRRVKIVLNKTEVKDFDKDIIDKSAFNRTISERGPVGKNLIWHLTDHNASLKSAVGKFSELKMDNGELIGVTNIPDTSWGNDVLTFYKSGQINQHSIGFSTVKDEEKEDHRLIKEVKLYEGSAVLWGANEFTPTLSVGKSILSDEIKTKYLALKKEFDNGKYSDDFFQIIEAQLKELERQLITKLMTDTNEPSRPDIHTDTNEILIQLNLLKSKI